MKKELLHLTPLIIKELRKLELRERKYELSYEEIRLRCAMSFFESAVNDYLESIENE